VERREAGLDVGAIITRGRREAPLNGAMVRHKSWEKHAWQNCDGDAAPGKYVTPPPPRNSPFDLTPPPAPVHPLGPALAHRRSSARLAPFAVLRTLRNYSLPLSRPSCEASWITANDIIALYGIFFPLPFCLPLRLNHCWKSGRREKEEETSLPRQARWPKEFRCRRMASIKRFHLSVPFVRVPLRNFRLDLRMPYTCSGISKTYFRERHMWQNVLFTLLEFINLSEMAMSLWDADLVCFKIKLLVYFYDIPIYIFCTYSYIHPYIHIIYPYTALDKA